MYTGVLGEVNDDALPGDFRQVDFNADGVINGLDEVPFGFPSRPQYQGNFSAGVGFKNFNFNFMLVGAHNVSRIIARGEYSLEYSIVFPFHLDDSWTPERADAWAANPEEAGNFINDPRYAHTRFRTGSPKGNHWVKDASYIRLQAAELSYDMQFAFLRSIGIQGLRLFANGNNLFIWTRLAEDRDGGNFQRENYPRVARYNFGVNLKF
ncbi:MAG: hypothetical protein AAFQ87_13665 [Bacteroidota bacterium]